MEVVVSSTASDTHTWNLIFLQLLLEELGHRVTNLGACVPDATLVTECRRLRPDLIVLSSVNGHGFNDGMRVISELRACSDLSDVPMVIGGKLGITGAPDESVSHTLRAAGFDGIFIDGAPLDGFRSYLNKLSSRVLI